MENFAQVLLLLGVTVSVIVTFNRFDIPSSLGYLLVGLILGPYTMGPVIDIPQIRALAEFGIVFLLFTIGLNFSLPQIHALRHQVLGLGTGQVLFTTAIVGLVAWWAGLTPMAAFVVGAVFAQSSTTIIGKQLAEQGEENSRHGKLGLAMSVFQDVTAVPFVVVIPVLGMAVGAELVLGALGWALAKALLAFALVFFVGRWLLRPIFHFVAERRSAEIFTLTVLLIALLAAWTTNSLGLSLAFGAFLAGMVIGETEFRHQVESTVRPFRDVLLGLFFIGIGMLLDPASLPHIWHWAILGAVVLLTSKALLVSFMVRKIGADPLTAWRTGLLLSVGGEFGFALLAIALSANVIDTFLGQIALTSVLFSMIAGPFIIQHNHAIASRLVRDLSRSSNSPMSPTLELGITTQLEDHVIIFGYGRIGQSVAHLLDEESIPYIALDLDPARVRQAHAAGEPVYYGDATDRNVLDLLGLDRARLVIISHDDVAASLKVLEYLRRARPELPVMVRTRDESRVSELQKAGATEVVPETLEAGLMIASQSLLLLDVPPSQVMRRIQEQRSGKYRLIREFFRGDTLTETADYGSEEHVHSIEIPPDCKSIGRQLGEVNPGGITFITIVRHEDRLVMPSSETSIAANDILVMHGSPDELQRAERIILYS
ncbi:cation:proton antiporter [Nitrosomonas communis]|uniref:cation:proton antiporter domain-containing protein n=1 Tax=Nitrosomonas communis TaxID=44574 RepID=UPI003D2A3A9E